MSDERVKRNLEDVGYAELGGERPMREVIRERDQFAKQRPKQLREQAYRERAWITAMAQSCICCWPIVKADTESAHEPWCVSHQMLLSKQAQEKLHR